MKAAGIVAEYNPLHNGHVYHIARTRELTGCDAVVAAMSGNYVQRGEPAILDKWTRAGHALRSGADLVVEIPVLFCLGNAGQYASAAVKILEATGKVTHLSFGSESGDTEVLVRIAGFLKDHSEEIGTAVRDMRGSGLSYPAARAMAYSALRGRICGTAPEDVPGISRDIDILNSSNDILALEYIRSLEKAVPVAVKRKGAGYTDQYDSKYEFQSGEALRTLTFSGCDVSTYVPECTGPDLKGSHITGVHTDKWFDILRYAVMSVPADIIEDCPSGGEGLAYLMKDRIAEADDWDGFIKSVQSKRYTYTRISRLCMQILLGITRERFRECHPEYIRVLGFNDTGRKLLSEIKSGKESALPLITNINKEKGMLSSSAEKLLELETYSSDIYNMMCGRNIPGSSDRVHRPVIIQ